MASQVRNMMQARHGILKSAHATHYCVLTFVHIYVRFKELQRRQVQAFGPQNPHLMHGKVEFCSHTH
jgi:hypothetical protein